MNIDIFTVIYQPQINYKNMVFLNYLNLNFKNFLKLYYNKNKNLLKVKSGYHHIYNFLYNIFSFYCTGHPRSGIEPKTFICIFYVVKTIKFHRSIFMV